VEAGGAAVFLHLKDAQDFFALGTSVHQVVVNLPKGGHPKQAAATLRAALDSTTLEALSWNEMVPEVEVGIEADRSGTFGMDAVVFLLVVLGMLNAMTMATYERMFELGVLTALGTRPFKVMGMIVLESLFLGLVSLAIGIALAAVVITLMPAINMSAMGEADFVGVALPSALKVQVAPLALIMSVTTVSFTCFIGGLYPAWKVSRMSPVDAMRYRA
jgi:putative ABC transport system permease protein